MNSKEFCLQTVHIRESLFSNLSTDSKMRFISVSERAALNARAEIFNIRLLTRAFHYQEPKALGTLLCDRAPFSK
jgi:hypothetical protein